MSKLDLNKAVEALWSNQEETTTKAKKARSLGDYTYDEQKMTYGDSPEVEGFYEIVEEPNKVGMGRFKAAPIRYYYDGKSKNSMYRCDVIIPPKVRKMIFDLSIVPEEQFNMSAAIVALACYGAKMIKQSKKDVSFRNHIDPDGLRERKRYEYNVNARKKK